MAGGRTGRGIRTTAAALQQPMVELKGNDQR
jgi:hypothetical protein